MSEAGVRARDALPAFSVRDPCRVSPPKHCLEYIRIVLVLVVVMRPRRLSPSGAALGGTQSLRAALQLCGSCTDGFKPHVLTHLLCLISAPHAPRQAISEAVQGNSVLISHNKADQALSINEILIFMTSSQCYSSILPSARSMPCPINNPSKPYTHMSTRQPILHQRCTSDAGAGRVPSAPPLQPA